MLKYLLDTNIISDLMRNPSGSAARRVEAVGAEAICTSIVVAGELRYGCAKKGSPRLTAQLEIMLGAIPVLPLEVPADMDYGAVRAALEAAGQPIGANDLLIAAHALALDLILVTHNTREFSRVRGLQVEDWL
ncbi:MAG: type II toxin-antitoxin system VapC family toxin [Comamonas sp.]|nr:type II toxin-antitoxin system VapC family toxin [Comamonas sp.]